MNRNRKAFLYRVGLVVALAVCGAFASCKPHGTEGSASAEMEAEGESASARHIQLPTLFPRRWYQVAASGGEAFVWIDSLNEKESYGRYYAIDGHSWAQPHTFSCTLSRRSATLTVDSVTSKVSLTKLLRGFRAITYAAPEYMPNTDTRYQKPTYRVRTIPDICYGHAEGYWSNFTGFEDKSYAKVVVEGFRKSLSKRPLDLMLDIYQPAGVDSEKPLILFIHGGAFYVGDRRDEALVGWCKHFASLGYITASMDYRLGFLPSKDDIERAGYMAVQDAHAAMRYLVSHAEEYGIDTSQIYVAGTSAGSITALNLAFMRDDNRPKASFGRKENLFHHGERTEDLGAIASSGNDIDADFHIVAVANMWGAINDLGMLRNSHTDIVSFHGDADQLVPFDRGYPFSDVSEGVGQRLFAEMFGSKSIDGEAQSIGLRSRFYPFPGEGHAFHVDENQNINQNWYFIRDSITTFFYGSMVPEKAVIAVADDGLYAIGCKDVAEVSWMVNGGFVLQADEDKRTLQVLWRADEDEHSVEASGTYHNGLGWDSKMNVDATANP